MMKKIGKNNERGGARVKFLIVAAVVFVVAYIGYQFLPVLYQSWLYKDLMQHNVDVAVTQGYQPSWVRDQLVKAGPEYGVPADAQITPTLKDNRVEVRVQFTRPIQFPGYTYQYEFDNTAISTAFLTFK
jgi:hypothetical protein